MSQPNNIAFHRVHRPGPGTAIIALRLFWIWPAFRLAQIFMFIAVTVAVCEVLRLKGNLITQGNPLTWWAEPDWLRSPSFDLIHAGALGLILLLFIALLNLGPYVAGQGVADSARALALLPAPRHRMALACWWDEALAHPALFLLTVGALMLALPYPLALRAWILVAATGVVLLVVGLKLALRSVVKSLGRDSSADLREARLKHLDLALPLVAMLATGIGGTLIVQGNVAVGIPFFYTPALAVIIWSAWRVSPQTKPVVHNSPTTTDSEIGFIPFRKVFREIFSISLVITSILAAVFLYLQKDGLRSVADVSFVIWIVFLTSAANGLASDAEAFLRPARVLPVSTKLLTLAILLRGFLTIFPGLGLCVLISWAYAPQYDALLYLLLLAVLALAVLTFVAVSAWSVRGTYLQSFYLILLAAIPYGALLIFVKSQTQPNYVYVLANKTPPPIPLSYSFLFMELTLLAFIFVPACITLHSDFFRETSAYRSEDTGGTSKMPIFDGTGPLWSCALFGGVAILVLASLWWR